MSRVIVKNLPSKCTEEELKEMFSSRGEVTDAKLVKTKQGTSRKFCFVGFRREEEADAAIKYFNKTYIGSCKVDVELAKPYGDEAIARPWSKYSLASSAHRKKQESNGGSKNENKGVERNKMNKLLEDYDTLAKDSSFQDFLDVHKQKENVKTWSDVTTAAAAEQPAVLNYEEEESGSEEEASSDERLSMDQCKDGGVIEDDSPQDAVVSTSTSDMEYLKTKIVGRDEDMKSGDTLEGPKSTKSHNKNRSHDKEKSHDEEKSHDDKKKNSSRKIHDYAQSSTDSECESENVEIQDISQATTPYTVKMLGLPFNAKKKDIEVFFHPLSVVALRFTQDSQGRPSGRAYADFQSEEDLMEALKRNKDCIRHRYIELFRDDSVLKKEKMEDEAKMKPWEMKATLAGNPEVESIMESGRIFVRNLPFCTQEEDLSELFGKYGPLTETTIPLDKTTNKPMGMAFITFMLPEHAANAFQALDGQIFQGRLLHLLPARPKTAVPTTTVIHEQKSSYKKKKETKDKSEAGQSLNWNSLFLGGNAVLDVMAEKYETDKSIILETDMGGGSAAVRMALGETEVVRETQEFLLEHGVVLEAFQEDHPKRSKTIILVKNLPSGTKEVELSKLFQPFGQLVRIILPPAGITALVEFAEPSHARQAFSRLAYTSFKHLPLYLEWAPINALRKDSGKVKAPHRMPETDLSETQETDNTGTVFVKNLNFSSTEASLHKLFSTVGMVTSVLIAKKRNAKDPSSPLSMGYGFVEYKTDAEAKKAVKMLQGTQLDDHALEVKVSKHRTKSLPPTRKSNAKKKQSSKILVRNVPFEATKREIRDLFSTFGSLKTVRLPKKLLGSAGSSSEHRGFGFVEFVSKEDATKAFEYLSVSTHLYGRRLVLEWAEQEESLEAIRKRTAEHFHSSSLTGDKKRRKQLSLALEND